MLVQEAGRRRGWPVGYFFSLDRMLARLKRPSEAVGGGGGTGTGGNGGPARGLGEKCEGRLGLGDVHTRCGICGIRDKKNTKCAQTQIKIYRREKQIEIAVSKQRQQQQQ